MPNLHKQIEPANLLERSREGIKLLAILDIRRRTKVDQLHVALVVKDDILVLDIPMDDTMLVEEEDGVRDLRKDATNGEGREAIGVDVDEIEEILTAW